MLLVCWFLMRMRSINSDFYSFKHGPCLIPSEKGIPGKWVNGTVYFWPIYIDKRGYIFKEIVLLHQGGKLDNFGFINCVTNANFPPYRVSKLTFQAWALHHSKWQWADALLWQTANAWNVSLELFTMANLLHQFS